MTSPSIPPFRIPPGTPATLTAEDVANMYEFRNVSVLNSRSGPPKQITRVRYISYNEDWARLNGLSINPIPRGSFRVFPNSEITPCPPGFLCPDDTTQPMHCPEGIYCPSPQLWYECPEGYFCPLGTVQPYKCHFFARCPRATVNPTRFGVFGFVIALAILTTYGFYVKSKIDAHRRADKELSLKKAELGLSFVNMEADEEAFSKTQSDSKYVNFDIDFTNISQRLPNGRYIMRDVSGSLWAGRSCAIMGPSGAGKSTLFSLLTGKSLRTTGEVRIGGKVGELAKYAKLVGFVPQEDIMIRDLTVSDILTHSAFMRLPSSMSVVDVKDKVARVTSFLGLSHVNDSIIGNEAQRGISGGQRKRVNIGMELVAEPAVLFLDEPTSGLDSSTALDVCSQLRRIAENQRMTVAAIIHSPSPATFAQFHDFILLGKGGRMVYCGPRDKARLYFESIGFKVPEGISESDFYMDVVSGSVPSSFDPSFRPPILFKYWEKHCQNDPIFPDGGKHADYDEYLKCELDCILTTAIQHFMNNVWWVADVFSEFAKYVINLILCRSDAVRSTPSGVQVMLLCGKRAIFQVYRSLGNFLQDQALHLACGALISISSLNMRFINGQPRGVCDFAPVGAQLGCRTPLDMQREIGIFICLGALFAGINVATQTFGDELVVYWRDTAAGMPTIPYFMAKVIVDIPRVIIAAFMYSLSLILCWPYRSQYWTLFSIILALYFTAFAMGYFLSTVFRRESVGLVGAGFTLAWVLVFGGVTPPISDVLENFPQFGWVWNISSPRWAIEALYIYEIQARQYNITNIGESHGYREGHEVLAMYYMAGIYVGWLALALLGLKLMNRDKQK